jgi:hypothetical protein
MLNKKTDKESTLQAMFYIKMYIIVYIYLNEAKIKSKLRLKQFVFL